MSPLSTIPAISCNILQYPAISCNILQKDSWEELGLVFEASHQCDIKRQKNMDH
jgi:hypothetical protein